MAALNFGIGAEWLHVWGWSFLRAWPIAFVYSLLVGPLAFRLAGAFLAPKG